MKKFLVAILNLKGFSGAINYINEILPILKERYAIETDVLTARKETIDYPFKVKTMPLIKNLRGYYKRAIFSYCTNFISKNYKAVNGHGELLKQDILTLHNLIHLTYEKLKLKPDGLWHFHQKMLSSSDNFKFLIANSNLMKKDLINRFSIPQDKIKVIYPSYNPRVLISTLNKKQAKKALGLNPDLFCFLLPASGAFEKRGVKRFIRIVKTIKDLRYDFQALITGKDLKSKEYLRLINYLSMEKTIKIIAPLKDVSTLYACGDCVIYPAQIEEFGIALMEAMVAKIPILCSPHIGVCELMTKQAHDFSICERDEEYIQKAIDLINGRVKTEIFLQNTKKISERTWEKTAAEIFDVYKNFI